MKVTLVISPLGEELVVNASQFLSKEFRTSHEQVDPGVPIVNLPLVHRDVELAQSATRPWFRPRANRHAVTECVWHPEIAALASY